MPNFDLAESLINLLKSPDARISMKAMESILKLVSLPEKHCAASLIKKTRIREYFAMKLVTEIISLPGPHCYPKVAPISLDEIQITEAYPWGEAIDLVAENFDWFPGKKELRQFLTTWDFLNRLIIESHHYFAVPMSRFIRRKVLQPIVKQILTRTVEEESLISFTALLIKLLDTTESMALRHQLMMFILGKHESTFNDEIKKDEYDFKVKHKSHLLGYKRQKPGGFLNAKALQNMRKKISAASATNLMELLIQRCNHISDDITIINLKIFESCLKSPEQIFMDNLILKFIDKRQYLEDKTFIPKFNIQEAVNAYRNMLPHNLRTSEYHDRATESYIHDYYTELNEVTRVCARLRWPEVLVIKQKKIKNVDEDFHRKSTRRKRHKSTKSSRGRTTTRDSSRSRSRSEDSRPYKSRSRSYSRSRSRSRSHSPSHSHSSSNSEEMYLSSEVSHLTSNSHPSNHSTNTSNALDYEPFEEGIFLNMLFDKLSDFCNQSYAVNLEVTNLIAKLLILPHPAVTEFFLNPEIYWKRVVKRANFLFNFFY